MMPVNTVIIEDNPVNRNRIVHLIEVYCPLLEIAAVADNVETGIHAIREHQPGLVILDVELPDGNGFDILNYFSPVSFKVIFFTAHLKYAYQAIKFNAIDFLAKPVSIPELVIAVEKVVAAIPDDDYYKRLENARLQYNNPMKVILPEPSGFSVTETKDIIKLEADQSYTHFFLSDRKKMTFHRVLKCFEDLLAVHPNFMRVHRSHLVNLDHVMSFSVHGLIKLSDGLTAPLGDSYREKFEEYFR